MPLAEHKNPVIGKHPAEAYSNISQLKESKFWIIRSEIVSYIGLKMNWIESIEVYYDEFVRIKLICGSLKCI